jgi:integrase
MNTLTTTNPEAIAQLNDIMHQAGQAANEAGARHAFEDHTARKASNTIRRKIADLALFETFLQSANVPAVGMYDHPEAWRGITWGIVEAFRNWMLQQGYAIGSINGRLSTVRTFAKIAARAGAITPQESILIASVQGYANKEARHIDESRRADGLQTRKGNKKAEAVTIPEDIAQTLKQKQPGTPQGKRDALIMCLLLDHGLRVSEIAILTRKAFDMKAGTFTFYRPKVNKTQTHTMTPDTRNAAREYLKHAPADGILWRKSSKGTGKLGAQLTETSATRTLNKRVELLGRHAGIEGLSPHDARHYDATFEANAGTPINRIMDKFGWNSPTMALRYIEAAKIANEGTARIKPQ